MKKVNVELGISSSGSHPVVDISRQFCIDFGQCFCLEQSRFWQKIRKEDWAAAAKSNLERFLLTGRQRRLPLGNSNAKNSCPLAADGFEHLIEADEPALCWNINGGRGEEIGQDFCDLNKMQICSKKPVSQLTLLYANS
jgi:hypothetical protein